MKYATKFAVIYTSLNTQIVCNNREKTICINKKIHDSFIITAIKLQHLIKYITLYLNSKFISIEIYEDD